MKFILIFSIVWLAAQCTYSQVPATDSTVKSPAKQQNDTVPYATFYFYRAFIPKLDAPLKKVPIYINDSLYYKLKANTYIVIKVFKEGKTRIAIDPGGGDEIITKVKLGNEYFYRCSIERGLWFGKPAIEPVPPKTGKEECGMIKTDE